MSWIITFFSPKTSLNFSIMNGHVALRLVIQWLSVLFLACLCRVIQKNKQNWKELKNTSFWSNWILLHFRYFIQLSLTDFHVSAFYINVNKFSWIYVPLLLLAYPSVLQVTRGRYFNWQITFVSSCPHRIQCVGCRPVVYANTISRQEAINNFAR